MLLCCFKEPKRTQSEEKVDEPDESYGTVTVGKTTETSNRLIRVAKKERAPLNKEEKRLIKQKSRESLRLQQEAASHAIVTPPDHEDEQVIVVLDAEQRLSYTTSNSSSPTTKSPARLSTSHRSSSSLHQSQSSINNEPVRGMVRSSASYGIQQLLQREASKESLGPRGRRHDDDSLGLTLKFEGLIEDLKLKHAIKIQELEQSHQTMLNNLRNSHETSMRQLILKHDEDQETMRREKVKELEQIRASFEDKLRIKEQEHLRIVQELQQRDQEWQLEKQEVMAEIQRLKTEANRIIALLEEESMKDENLSPERKQNLTREVESLQLVVEMRTQELHRLREERARHLNQLEEFANTRNLLEKMTAKVEDLQAQLKRKTELERQLSLEKSKLESSVEENSRQKDRVSMQMESLQWRIRNKMDLPKTSFMAPAPYEKRPISLPQTLQTEDNRRHNFGQWQQNRLLEETEEVIIRKSPAASQGLMTPNNNTSVSDCDHQVDEEIKKHSTSDNGCGSITSFIDDDEEEIECLNANEVAELSRDRKAALSQCDSLNSKTSDEDDDHDQVSEEGYDEGLGDIGSDDSAHSPQPASELQLQHKTKEDVKPLSSPADERMPSRIALSVQTAL